MPSAGSEDGNEYGDGKCVQKQPRPHDENGGQHADRREKPARHPPDIRKRQPNGPENQSGSNSDRSEVRIAVDRPHHERRTRGDQRESSESE